MSRFDAMAAAKIFSGKPENTPKNLALVQYPALVSLKYDGWRFFELNGELRLRSLKPPANLHTRKVMKEVFSAAASFGNSGLDGEACASDIWNPNCMQACTSAFGSIMGEPKFTFNVFDSHQHPEDPFSERLKWALEAVDKLQNIGFDFVQPVEHRLVHNQEELFVYYDEIVARGGEGVMGRLPGGRYKYGRSTMRESLLWALKPYVDDEAQIIGFVEMLENQNELTTNERGYASRQGLKENMVPKGTLGKFICRSPKFKETFSVGMGVGLTEALRQEIWDHQASYLDRWIKYKYQEIGVVDRPRQPKFMGFRAIEDMAGR